MAIITRTCRAGWRRPRMPVRACSSCAVASALRVLPPAFVDKLRCMLPEEQVHSVLSGMEVPRNVAFRINLLRAVQPDDTLAQLRGQGLDVQPAGWCANAFLVPAHQRAQLLASTCHARHEVYVQSLPSMAAALALQPQPGERVLDLCAAPGSKTSHIAMLMRNEGELVANDRSRARFFKLQRLLADLGARAQLENRDGVRLARRFPQHFHRALVDAPCSGEGRFRVQEPESYADWRPAKVMRLRGEQRALLHAAVDAVQPGGVLVYATCTLSPEENELVLARALEVYAGQLRIEPLPVRIPGALAGLTEWRRKQLPPEVGLACRVLPSSDMEGFFLARLRKLGPGEVGGAGGVRCRGV